VVTCCAKAEKSKKATGLLLDWVSPLKFCESGEVKAPDISVFNSVINACEICEATDLTAIVLEKMKDTHGTDGNTITFNVALKRLARAGNIAGCEGIINNMISGGLRPSVVSYTMALASCAISPKDPIAANEWLQRMRSRNVKPNVITYNTAMAACLDGKLESTALASAMATDMLAEARKQLEEGHPGNMKMSVIPDQDTMHIVRQLMQQLRENWRSGEIDEDSARTDLRQPFIRLKELLKEEDVKLALQKVADQKTDELKIIERDEFALEYNVATSAQKEPKRKGEV